MVDKEADARMQRWFIVACGLSMMTMGGFTAGFALFRGDYAVSWIAGCAAAMGALFCGIALFDGRHPFDDA